MYKFENIVYLNVEKTGSTFVRFFLEHNLILPTGHASPTRQPNEDKCAHYLYLTSIRDPLAQYASLFRFGVAGKGSLFSNLKPYKRLRLYDSANVQSFEKWLAFVLNPRIARYTGDTYKKTQPNLYGLMTFRYLNMAIEHSEHHLRKRKTRETLQQVYETCRYPATVLKNEQLDHDLFRFSQSEPARRYFKPASQVQAWLDTSPKVNTTQTKASFDRSLISSELKDRIKEREWFLYRNFYPQNL